MILHEQWWFSKRFRLTLLKTQLYIKRWKLTFQSIWLFFQSAVSNSRWNARLSPSGQRKLALNIHGCIRHSIRYLLGWQRGQLAALKAFSSLRGLVDLSSQEVSPNSLSLRRSVNPWPVAGWRLLGAIDHPPDQYSGQRLCSMSVLQT